MTLIGTVQNGAIILENGVSLPEGTRVKVDVEPTDAEGLSLRAFLLKHAGTVHNLPSDFAEQHDHYIHGTPKR